MLKKSSLFICATLCCQAIFCSENWDQQQKNLDQLDLIQVHINSRDRKLFCAAIGACAVANTMHDEQKFLGTYAPYLAVFTGFNLWWAYQEQCQVSQLRKQREEIAKSIKKY